MPRFLVRWPILGLLVVVLASYLHIQRIQALLVQLERHRRPQVHLIIASAAKRNNEVPPSKQDPKPPMELQKHQQITLHTWKSACGQISFDDVRPGSNGFEAFVGDKILGHIAALELARNPSKYGIYNDTLSSSPSNTASRFVGRALSNSFLAEHRNHVLPECHLKLLRRNARDQIYGTFIEALAYHVSEKLNNQKAVSDLVRWLLQQVLAQGRSLEPPKTVVLNMGGTVKSVKNEEARLHIALAELDGIQVTHQNPEKRTAERMAAEKLLEVVSRNNEIIENEDQHESTMITISERILGASRFLVYLCQRSSSFAHVR